MAKNAQSPPVHMRSTSKRFLHVKGRNQNPWRILTEGHQDHNHLPRTYGHFRPPGRVQFPVEQIGLGTRNPPPITRINYSLPIDNPPIPQSGCQKWPRRRGIPGHRLDTKSLEPRTRLPRWLRPPGRRWNSRGPSR